MSFWDDLFYGAPWTALRAPGAIPVPAKVESPVLAPIVAPGATVAPKPTFQEQVAALILAENWTYSYNAYGVYQFLSKGGAIHKIDKPTSLAIAQVIMDHVAGGLTVPYLMACICEESLFDPACENGNYSYVGHVGSNPSKAPEGFDVGISQLKLSVLMADKKIDVTAAHAFAVDFTKAIPYMATTMKLLLAYADAMIQDITRTDIPAVLKNRYAYSTGAYNFGRTGMKKLAQTTMITPPHCVSVMNYEKKFAKALNIKSVFD